MNLIRKENEIAHLEVANANNLLTAYLNPQTDNLKMSSREIAELTGKLHKNVLRDVEVLNENYEKLGLLKVEPSSYINSQNREFKEFMLTKRQTLDLMMGYDFALRMKVTDRWEELEKENSKPLSLAEMVMYNAIRHVENEKRLLALQEQNLQIVKQQDELQNRVLEVEAKMTTKDATYYTISGWAKLQGKSVDKQTATRLGKQCSSICNSRKIMKGKEYDAKYGEINTYPNNILEEVFENYFND